MKKVLVHSELIGKYTVRAVRQSPKIDYGSLLNNRWLIPIIFFGRVSKSTRYAISGKKTRKFFSQLFGPMSKDYR